MEKTTTYGLPLGQMAKLFLLGVKDSKPKQTDTDRLSPEVLLQLSLSDAVSGGWLPTDVLAMLPTCAPDGMERSLSQSQAQFLAAHKAELAWLKTIKNHGKKVLQSNPSAAGKATATTIYYAAIANALVYHRERITENSPDELLNAFASLLERPWMVSVLKSLFVSARDRCKASLP